eukprot:CAMPEP_0175042546 /NCGR_PEP_ID=MMETSP0052_2-20121109/2635_1 /TAXON_ID=51329 ORGANISM="Polytomella parva, Strain SAG 63-3" /NCGR_SAMPLE_ID=MMETSP0052_2 /ASSEMBLY_ACC=CAM_ASM_000194 /LENGTH=929 /DNA_ID=CAMNT_0016305393 /DNA_START=374 /DNA_END=3163 /DNA_ORIENTATION=+
MNGRFANALWLSSRTASTLGFDTIKPNPDCPLVNITVMLQVICASLVNYFMLGLVFARFSAPFKRAETIRFSSNACVSRQSNGLWALSLRVANVRKHQILKPRLRMIVTAVDATSPSNYLFEQLEIDDIVTQETNLELGFPANVTHVISATSPLLGLSLQEMDTRLMEVLVFIDGIDAMTSKNLTARRAYSAGDVRVNETFVPLQLEMRGKVLGLNFKEFDRTVVSSMELLAEYVDSSVATPRACTSVDLAAAEALTLDQAQSQLWHLRHQTFRKLTERHVSLGNRYAPAAAALAKLSQLSHKIQRNQQQQQKAVVLKALHSVTNPTDGFRMMNNNKMDTADDNTGITSKPGLQLQDEDAVAAAAIVAALPGLNGYAAGCGPGHFGGGGGGGRGGGGGEVNGGGILAVNKDAIKGEDPIGLMPTKETAADEIFQLMKIQQRHAQKWGLIFNGPNLPTHSVADPEYHRAGGTGESNGILLGGSVSALSHIEGGRDGGVGGQHSHAFKYHVSHTDSHISHINNNHINHNSHGNNSHGNNGANGKNVHHHSRHSTFVTAPHQQQQQHLQGGDDVPGEGFAKEFRGSSEITAHPELPKHVSTTFPFVAATVTSAAPTSAAAADPSTIGSVAQPMPLSALGMFGEPTSREKPRNLDPASTTAALSREPLLAVSGTRGVTSSSSSLSSSSTTTTAVMMMPNIDPSITLPSSSVSSSSTATLGGMPPSSSSQSRLPSRPPFSTPRMNPCTPPIGDPKGVFVLDDKVEELEEDGGFNMAEGSFNHPSSEYYSRAMNNGINNSNSNSDSYKNYISRNSNNLFHSNATNNTNVMTNDIPNALASLPRANSASNAPKNNPPSYDSDSDHFLYDNGNQVNDMLAQMPLRPYRASADTASLSSPGRALVMQDEPSDEVDDTVDLVVDGGHQTLLPLSKSANK